jgi:hypothetical protein
MAIYFEKYRLSKQEQWDKSLTITASIPESIT